MSARPLKDRCCGNCAFGVETHGPYSNDHGLACHRHAPAAVKPEAPAGIPTAGAAWPRVGYGSFCGDWIEAHSESGS